MPIHCHKLFQQQNQHFTMDTRASVTRFKDARTHTQAHVTSQTARDQLCAKLGGEEKTFKTLAFLRE